MAHIQLIAVLLLIGLSASLKKVAHEKTLAQWYQE